MVGNRWYKCDLHLHSTASECFRDKSVTAEQWITECKEKGLDCVALTDHNTGANINEYKEVAEKNNIVLFPGVELTCGESKTHLLVLFDRNSGTTEVEDFILKMGIERDKMASSDANSPKTVLEVINYAENHGLVVIPAHIDEYNGLSGLSHAVRQDVFKSPNISSVQVVQKEFFDILQGNLSGEDANQKIVNVGQRYGNVGEDTLSEWLKPVREAINNNINFLTFSDNPHEEGDSKHGLWGIGQRYTNIKMKGNPDLYSLRDALMLGKNRTQSDFINSNKNDGKVSIKTLSFSGTTLSSEEVTVEFSNNLTTIIGGRGTGKSCITRLLFYVLGKEDNLIDYPEIYSDYSKFAKIADGDSGVFTENTKVILEASYEGSMYKIIRTPTSHQVFSLDSEKNEELTDFKRLEILSGNISLYMQKQIYEISKNQKSILELVDTFNFTEIAEINEEINSYKSDILKINLDNVKLKEEVDKKQIFQLGIEDLKNKILKLGTGRNKQVFEKNNQETQSHKIMADDLSQFRKIPERLQSLVDQVFIPTKKLEVSSEIDGFRSDLLDKIKNEIDGISKHILAITENIDEYQKEMNNSKWLEGYKKTVKDFEQLKAELEPGELESMKNLSLLHEELKVKENQLEIVIEKEDKFKQNNIEIEELSKQVDSSLKRLTEERRRFCRDIFKDIDGITAQIQPNRDFLSYVEELRVILGKEDSFESEFDSLLQNLKKSNYSYKEVYRDIKKIRLGEESTIFTSKKLINYFNKLSNTQLSDVQVLTPNDLITITIEINKKKVSLSNASAGQKTSAILSMILAHGDSVLVLDQPEDDLDSQLINNLIVKSILTRKENRQIIIITHNANIPVNGDSEWLVCMGDLKEVMADLSGSVDEPTVKNRICTVMEGGEDAFNHRAVRYGFKQNLK
ncbi:TrlF family AAA-like ATPase [Carnobacterium divergens]|uniref:TrlF family AAA-like ATPase n=1 Tax=Carnobacterium divergens TaxID=2748 RepID=UPI00128CFFEC|nr:PHP domain-containing protein [Carnobacterium divergens]MPQ22864.1 PHP domain-containing protein [Carnobacterium divergens]